MKLHNGFLAVTALLAITALYACGSGDDDHEDGAEEQLACPGALLDTPRICDVKPVNPTGNAALRFLSFDYCATDGNGDIASVCVVLATATSEGSAECFPIDSVNRGAVSFCGRTPPVLIGPRGMVEVYGAVMGARDSVGRFGQSEPTLFNCCQ